MRKIQERLIYILVNNFNTQVLELQYKDVVTKGLALNNDNIIRIEY